MKTVLAPNAPWPPKDAEVCDKRKPQKTDTNFESWAHKQKDVLITGAILGLPIKQEIKCKIKKS